MDKCTFSTDEQREIAEKIYTHYINKYGRNSTYISNCTWNPRIINIKFSIIQGIIEVYPTGNIGYDFHSKDKFISGPIVENEDVKLKNIEKIIEEHITSITNPQYLTILNLYPELNNQQSTLEQVDKIFGNDNSFDESNFKNIHRIKITADKMRVECYGKFNYFKYNGVTYHHSPGSKSRSGICTQIGDVNYLSTPCKIIANNELYVFEN